MALGPASWSALAIAGAFALGLWAERRAPHESVSGRWRVNAGLFAAATLARALVFGGGEWQVARWTEASHFGAFPLAGAPAWLAAALTLPALDLVSYGWHRANHRVALLWRFHRVHHADPAVDVSTSLRFHPGEILLSLPVRFAAIALLGAPVAGVVLFEAVFGAANALEHGNVALPARLEGALGRVLVTPALHRRHHSQRAEEHDANYGTTFSVWDRAARTLCPGDSASHFALGLPEGATGDPRGLGAMLLEPFRSGATPR
jgi:sterol desaturase/sphingolipid hydroxylase (fatty acid hydroxylase superfamily)